MVLATLASTFEWTTCIVLIGAVGVAEIDAQGTRPRSRVADRPFAGVRVVDPKLAAYPGVAALGQEDLFLGVAESAQGNRDLNGDGDAADLVIHHVALDDGTVTNLGIVGQPLEPVVGRRCLFRATEGPIDWNGDGDRSDVVLVLGDAGSRTVTSSGLALDPLHPVVLHVGDLAAFSVLESSQGQDLDDDGDQDDSVLYVWDLRSSSPRNLGLPGSLVAIDQTSVLFTVDERDLGDLDGDGDALDRVLEVYDAATTSVQNLGLALAPVPQTGLPIFAGGELAEGTLAAFLVSEAAQGGRDLDGDGDALDLVVHVYDPAFGVANLRLAGGQLNLGPPVGFTGSFQIAGDRVLFNVFEAAQGASDLNGDGDADDVLLYAHRRGVPGATSLGVPGGFIQASEQFVAYPERESSALEDLDGDGDRDDAVAVLRRFDEGTPFDTHLATVDPSSPTFPSQGDARSVGLEGAWMYMVVSESEQGETDLNGDGDALDYVMHVVDSRTRSIRNLRQAVRYEQFGNPRLSGGVLTFTVSEADQGGLDLNADGDALDDVIHLYLVDWDRIVNTGQSAAASLPHAVSGVGRTRLFLRSEASESVDFNHDGDETDSVVQVLVLDHRQR